LKLHTKYCSDEIVEAAKKRVEEGIEVPTWFGCKRGGKTSLRRPACSRKYVIKADPKEQDGETWKRLLWLRTGAGTGLVTAAMETERIC